MPKCTIPNWHHPPISLLALTKCSTAPLAQSSNERPAAVRAEVAADVSRTKTMSMVAGGHRWESAAVGAEAVAAASRRAPTAGRGGRCWARERAGKGAGGRAGAGQSAGEERTRKPRPAAAAAPPQTRPRLHAWAEGLVSMIAAPRTRAWRRGGGRKGGLTRACTPARRAGRAVTLLVSTVSARPGSCTPPRPSRPRRPRPTS